jgi:hypothetical protein
MNFVINFIKFRITNVGASPTNRSLEIAKIKALSVNLVDAFVA